jgi:large subunit ribosomal protein L18e
MVKLNKTNPKTIELINYFKEKSYTEKAAIWNDFAKRLSRPTRRKAQVNISKINRHSKNEEVVLVPGKVLGNGKLDHKVSVGALSFSRAAEDKIESAGGECLDLFEIIEINKKGSKIKIIE